jgi:4-amino-4-deoxy-L-arabinose transferase-like glycosyltransferase
MVCRTPWLLACAVVCLVGLVYDFAGYPLLDPDEGRNAEVAREMSVSGDLVLPRLNAVPYLDKPVLYFAVGAVAMKVLGPTVFAARLPSLLFTFATVLVLAWFGRRLFGPDGAWTAAVATAATPFAIAYGRTVIFDSALTFFVVLALVGFYLSVESFERQVEADRSSGRQPGEWWTTLAWGAMALGVLTKGPVALAIPLMVAVPFAIWRRAWRALADPLSILLFVAVITPWVLAMSREIPDFLHYALVTETARRLTTDELQRRGPLWYFAAVFPAAALPWTLIVIGAWRTIRQQRDRYGNLDGRIAYLLLWIAVPLLFFSISQSKRPQYVLPLVPAIGLLVAAAWRGHPHSYPGARVAAAGLAALGAFLIGASGAIGNLVHASNAVAQTIPLTAMVLGAVCIIAAVWSWVGRRHRGILLLALAVPVSVVPVVGSRLMDAVGRERSALEVARALQQIGDSGTQVVAAATFPLSLPFYLRRTVILSTADGSELTSNYVIRHFDTWSPRSATIRPPDYWREALIACTRPTAFVVRSDDEEKRTVLGAQLDLLLDTGKYAAYGPCGMTNLADAVR